jgi:hypothetical protein
MAALFGEGPGRFVVSGERSKLEAIPGAEIVGEVGGDAIEIGGLRVTLAAAAEAHAGGLRDAFA